jgi:hypothetical protein
LRELSARSRNQHAQVFASENRAETRCDHGVAGDFHGAASIDGGTKVTQECYAGGARFDMLAHLFAGALLDPAIDVL